MIKRGMMKTRGRRDESKYLMALAATCLAFSTSAFATEGHFDRTLPVTGPVEVDRPDRRRDGHRERRGRLKRSGPCHHPGVGWVILRRGSREKGPLLETHPPVEQHGDTITIGAITQPGLQHNISISYELVVPAETRLNSKTGSGDQTIRGSRGRSKFRADPGDIRASNVGARTRAGHRRVPGKSYRRR